MIIGTIYLVAASVLWALVHSLLASHGAKAVIRRISGPIAFDRLYRFSYNFFSVASFFPIVLMLFSYPDVALYTIPAPWVYLTAVVQGLAGVMAIATLVQTDPFEFLGLKQLTESSEARAGVLVTDGWYGLIRHPLYVDAFVLLWLIPDMTVNRLALCIVLTLYLVIGAYFEERKLLRDYGPAYAEYKARVPMFIPRLPQRP
jgi:protein-S-isoprenylcysteine O-methyltransferase Ste14